MFGTPFVEVTWSPEKRCLFVKGRTARGLTQVLQAGFYPHYRYRDAQRPTKGSGARVRKGRTAALARGKWLDRDVGALCAQLKKTSGTDFAALLENDRHAFWRQRHPGLRPLCVWLQQHGWTPRTTQLCVGHAAWRLATRVDLVAKHQNGGWGIFELKCGFDGYYEASTGKNMLEPLYFCPDAPKWQHQLQLLVTKRLFEHTYPAARLYDTQGYVMRVGHDQRVQAVPLVEWNIRIVALVEAKLQATAQETRVQRKSRIRRARHKRKRKPSSE